MGLDLISYGRLARLIHAIGWASRSHGISRGQVAAIYAEDPVLHAVLVLALTRIGVVTLSVRGALPTDLVVDVVVTDVPRRFDPAQRVVPFDQAWLDREVAPMDAAEIGSTAPDDPCRIVLTSGTTGEPRGICFSHRQVMERVARHDTIMGSAWPGCDRCFVDLGLSTSLGFFFLIQMLIRGGMRVFRGADAGGTMQAFGLYKIRGMFASPAALAEFINYYEQSPGFASPFEVIVSGGSPLSPRLAERVRARLCSNVVSAYGSTETSMVASAPAHAIAHVPGAVGYVLPGVSVQAVDEADRPLPTGSEGRLRISGQYNVDGYVGNPPDARGAFRDGWFYPGDIGQVSAEGLLVISGREKAIINLGGDKISPERIESALAGSPGVDDVAAVGIVNSAGIEEIHIAVVSTRAPDEAALAARCHAEFQLAGAELRFARVAAIPRNDAGKIDRARLAELVSGR